MVEETEATKEEIKVMINRTLGEIDKITQLTNEEGFNISNKNYDLKFHYRVMLESIGMLREMLIKDYKYF